MESGRIIGRNEGKQMKGKVKKEGDREKRNS